MVDAGRLVELFKEACSLTGSEQEAFIRKVRDEDADLGNSLAELMGQEGPVATEPGSFAKKLKDQYGSEADPHISLEGESEGSDFASEIVQRLAGRGEAYGRYKLKGEVARGGQGAILRVWDEDLRRNLAMKVVLGKAEATGDTPHVDSKTLGRFLEEAQVTGQLDHPNIVPVHELGLDDHGQVYFTMKLVKGRDLKAIFDLVCEGKEGWTQTRALNVLLKVCEAMAYAHSKGVIHRDLKPGNVMVGKFGEVYVMDWGLAKVMGQGEEKDIRIKPLAASSEIRSDRKEEASDDSPLITMDGDVVGTPAYMSPEQARGDLGAMGPASDVYAVGAMLYHLLAGHMPYVPPGARLNNYAVWARVQEGTPAPLVKEAPDAPPELMAICEKAMARNGPDRYADMAHLAEDLSDYLEGRVVRAYETGSWPAARKWMSRNRLLTAAIASAVLVLIHGMVVAWILKRQSDKNFHLAEARREEAESRTEDLLRLSALQEVQDLFAEVDGLWPPHPEKVPQLEDFVDRAEELMESLDEHRAKRDEVTAWAGRAETDWERSMKESQRFDSWTPGYEPIEHSEGRSLVLKNQRFHQGNLLTRKEARWWSVQLTKLVQELGRLQTDLLATDAVTSEYGWSVGKRLALARELEQSFEEGGLHDQVWSAAMAGLRETYGFEMDPQMSLVPIGQDPDSGLWEFAQVMTGEIPRRDEDGRLRVSEKDSLVFVLIPGTKYVWKPGVELLTKEVQIAAFFYSKFEVTQGQWRRVAGTSPWFYGPTNFQSGWSRDRHVFNLTHPVEQVSWVMADVWSKRLGLRLPSGAEWEYASGAGSHDKWWTGDDASELPLIDNLADSYAVGGGAWPREDWEDGFLVHAPVGILGANPFGVHDVHGNVSEWISNTHGGSLTHDKGGEGVAYRWCRGGSWRTLAEDARLESSRGMNAEFSTSDIGFRPARAITGEIRYVGEGK